MPVKKIAKSAAPASLPFIAAPMSKKYSLWWKILKGLILIIILVFVVFDVWMANLFGLDFVKYFVTSADWICLAVFLALLVFYPYRKKKNDRKVVYPDVIKLLRVSLVTAFFLCNLFLFALSAFVMFFSLTGEG